MANGLGQPQEQPSREQTAPLPIEPDDLFTDHLQELLKAEKFELSWDQALGIHTHRDNPNSLERSTGSGCFSSHRCLYLCGQALAEWIRIQIEVVLLVAVNKTLVKIPQSAELVNTS